MTHEAGRTSPGGTPYTAYGEVAFTPLAELRLNPADLSPGLAAVLLHMGAHIDEALRGPPAELVGAGVGRELGVTHRVALLAPLCTGPALLPGSVPDPAEIAALVRGLPTGLPFSMRRTMCARSPDVASAAEPRESAAYAVTPETDGALASTGDGLPSGPHPVGELASSLAVHPSPRSGDPTADGGLRSSPTSQAGEDRPRS